MKLTRFGLLNDSSTTRAAIDNLNYYYKPDSNLLLKVTDHTTNPQGFKDDGFRIPRVGFISDESDDYAYDTFGNMVKDENKWISSITYNHLNLPVTIINNMSSTNNLNYIYNAIGRKVEKIHTYYYQVNPRAMPELRETKTEYTEGGFQYLTDFLQFIPHAEGYYDNLKEKYIFNYKDHLGNVRVSYHDTNSNGQIEAATEILEENNYYPMGAVHQGYNTNVNSNNSSLKYRFNNKEYQDELGLGLFDFNFRQYDPVIGRFTTIDPMADFVNYQSPFVFSDNSPIANIDADGLGIFNVIGNLFRRATNGVRRLFNSNCSCSANEESLRDSWIRDDFGGGENGGSGGTVYASESTSSPREPRSTVESLNISSAGFFSNVNSSISSPVMNIASMMPVVTPDIPKININGKVVEIRKRLTFEIAIEFKSSSDVFQDDVFASKTLNSLLKTLIDYPHVKALILGNTSSDIGINEVRNINTERKLNGKPSTIGKIQLSRAEAIRRFLIGKGINGNRLEIGHGKIRSIGQKGRTSTIILKDN